MFEIDKNGSKRTNKINNMKKEDWISIEEKGMPEKEGFYLVYCPYSYPKNYRGVVAELYIDANFYGFYDEAYENYIEDATHYILLPGEPEKNL